MSTFYADPSREFERLELPLPIAFLLSTLLFALIAIVAVLYLDRHRPAVPKPTTVHVVLLVLPKPPAPPQVAPPPEPLAPPPPPPAVAMATPTGTVSLASPAAPAPARPPKPPRSRHLTHVRAPPRPARPIPVVQQSIVPPRAALAAPRPAASDPAARDSLEARIRQAIRAAFHFPEAAREMGSHGTAIVGFIYRDRAAFAVRLISSSRSSVLDREAVQIVRDTALPPPGKLAGQSLNLEVPIVFDITADDD